VSKIESSLDKLFAKLVQIKDTGKARLCALWQKLSPHMHLLKKMNYADTKAFVIRFKWRILLLLIVLYAGSKAYDYYFPAAANIGGGPQTITSVVVEKKDIPLIILAHGPPVTKPLV